MHADPGVETLRRSFRDRYRDDVAALGAAQKSSRGAPPYSLFVNRPLGRRIAAVAHQLGLRPNQVSIVSWILTMSGIALFAFGATRWPLAVGAVALLVVGYAVDAADGQLARLTTGGTIAGEWLDHCLDAVKLGAFHGAVAVSAHRHTDEVGSWPLYVAIAFGIVASAAFFMLILTDMLRRTNGLQGPPRPTSWWFVLLGLPTDYGVQCLWMVLRPASSVFFAGYALVALANLGYLVVGGVGRFRQLLAADASRRGA